MKALLGLGNIRHGFGIASEYPLRLPIKMQSLVSFDLYKYVNLGT